MLLKIRNPINQVREISFLEATANDGATSLTVKNNNGISSGDYVVLEEVGTEHAELKEVSTPSGADTVVLAAAIDFDHSDGTVVYKIPYNQVNIEYRINPHSAWQTLTTIDLDVDQLYTYYDHTSGDDEYEYRTRYYNENDTLYSDYSPILKATGFTSKQVSPIITAVLRRLGDRAGKYISREEVMEEVIFVHDEMVDSLINASHEYYKKPFFIQTKNYKHEYDLPDNFREIYKVFDAQGGEVFRISDQRSGRATYDLTGLQSIYFSDVPSPGRNSSTDTAPSTLLTLDAVTEGGTWTATDDAENVAIDNTEFKVGTGAISFDIDVSDDADNKAGVVNDGFTSVDWSDYEDVGKIRAWVYIPNVTYVSSVGLTWGSSSSAHWAMTSTRTYEDEGLRSGWNWVEFDWADSDNITETSTPDSSAVDYVKIELNYSSDQDDMTGVRFDQISVANSWAANRAYKVEYQYQPAKITNELDELSIPPGQAYVLVEKVTGNIMQGMEGKQTAGTRMTERADAKMNRFTSRNARRSKQPWSARPYGRKRMYGARVSRHGSSGNPHHRNYWEE